MVIMFMSGIVKDCKWKIGGCKGFFICGGFRKNRFLIYIFGVDLCLVKFLSLVFFLFEFYNCFIFFLLYYIIYCLV